ncbi:MAG TPA: gliding motility-associated C-terminal domain-containing protein [Ohtaekwangia sp.]|nr:gliding motility-associated C-terminal domain-containing protein [Ohtaekwangia sp.]
MKDNVSFSGTNAFCVFLVLILLMCNPLRSAGHYQNQPPVITGQTDLSTEEEQPVTIEFGHITVSDPDNTYPLGFTMTVLPGTGYTVNERSITPANGFTGILSIPIVVNDGFSNSNTFPFQITVTPKPVINTPPTITGQVSLTTPQDQPITIDFGHLSVNDPDNTYPDGFSMVFTPGINYSINANTITPATGFTGTLNIPVVVNDGTNNSNSFSLQITVTPAPVVNTPPTITGQASLSTQENQPIAIGFNDVMVTDPDNNYPAGFTLSLSPGTNYTINANTITPATGFRGILSVPVIVNDGTDNSNSFPLQITVTPAPVVNTPPTITGQAALSMVEGEAITIGFENLVVSDPDNSYPTGFTMTLSAGSNYTVTGSTITPQTGFNGILTVPVIVNDGTDNSNVFSLQLSVTPAPVINTKPIIVGQVPVSMLNNQSLTIDFSHLLVTDPDNIYPDNFTLSVFSGDNYTVTGHTITPNTGFTGILSVGVAVNDGTQASDAFSLKINVSPASTNVKPVITGQLELTTFQNTPFTVTLSHLIVTDPDNPYPTGFTLSLMPGTNYTVSNNTITPAPGFTGNLSVGVSVSDGVAQSETFLLRISVIDKAQLQIVGQQQITIREDSIAIIELSHLQINDPENEFPAGFSIEFDEGDNYQVTNNQITPAQNFFGDLTVGIRIANGERSSNTFNMVIIVTPVNDAPVFTNFETTALDVTQGVGPIYLAKEITIADVDHETLVFAEVSIDPINLSLGKEQILAQATQNIQTVYDPNTGILILLGQATLAEYQTVLQSVQYHYTNDTLPSATTKRINFKLNDGISLSEIKTKIVSLTESVELDIPNAFTPNNDNANDTWRITNGQADNLDAIVRVFDKRGLMVYESYNLTAWDGRYKGEVVPPDTYYFVIELKTGQRHISKKGIVTVLR